MLAVAEVAARCSDPKNKGKYFRLLLLPEVFRFFMVSSRNIFYSVWEALVWWKYIIWWIRWNRRYGIRLNRRHGRRLLNDSWLNKIDWISKFTLFFAMELNETLELLLKNKKDEKSTAKRSCSIENYITFFHCLQKGWCSQMLQHNLSTLLPHTWK